MSCDAWVHVENILAGVGMFIFFMFIFYHMFKG